MSDPRLSNDDDLKKLARALQDAPAPDQNAKEAALHVAEENFTRLQETDPAARPSEDRATTPGFLKGLAMTFSNNLRPLLLTTSSLVVLGVGFVLVQPNLRPAFEDAEIEAVVVEPMLTDGRERVEADATEPVILEPIIEEPVIALEEVESFAAGQSRLQASPAAPKVQGAIAQRSIIAPQEETRPVIEPPNTEQFPDATPNPLKITSEDPVSTFSIDVDTASYAFVRRSLNNGQLPNPDAVRVEEMVNYFTYDYPAPTGDTPFATQVSVTQTPWNPGTQLVQIGIQGELPAIADRPPLNLVFLIDTSGSMNSPDKLPLLIQSFRLMLPELRPDDQIAIVTYAGSAGTVLEPTPASERAKITAALENLGAGGSTAGEAGLRQAYALAEDMADDGDISRVILATDGDFNVGLSGIKEMERFIEDKRDSGTYLSVLGFGRGNLNDALMQTLAQNGNGQAAYIDTLSEARKVLVDQLSGALFPIAQDVKIQVEWNPSQIAEYRLIGYETRALRREDFNNDKVDAGEIGAGHQVTALYEVTPVGSDAIRNDPLRYGDAIATTGSSELGFLRLRYKEPGEATSQLIETPITGEADTPGFATAIAGFAELLRGSDYLESWGYADAIALATETRGDDRFGYRNEAISLMRLAESLNR